MLQKSVAVPLLAPEPGEDAVRGPVSLPGVRPCDAVRNAHRFMRGACVPVQPSLQGADLLRDGEDVHCVQPARATGSIRRLVQVLVLCLFEDFLHKVLNIGTS